MSETVLISGGSGLIGSCLAEKLKLKGYNVKILGRSIVNNPGFLYYKWDVEIGLIQDEALDKVDYIIHLAGANIGEKRWTKKRRNIIIESRVLASKLLFEKVKKDKHKIKAFISASATGYYGAATTEKIFKEEDQPATDFLGSVCSKWEKSAELFEDIGVRIVKIRTGIVLTKRGGALEKIALPLKLGFGIILGTGNQYMPWIHIDDLCNIYIKAIEDGKITGTYNAVAPEHIKYKDLIKVLTTAFRKKNITLFMPAMLLKLIFGEMSAIILKGSRVSSEKIISTGYNFLFPDLHSALKNLFFEK